MKKPAWLTGKSLMSKSIFLVIGGVVIFITYALITGSLRAGFGADETITKSEKRDKQGNVIETTTTTTFQDAKTLWDWLSLAGVPLSLAILGYVLQQLQQARTEQQAKAEKEIAESNQQEEALQNYLDRLSELLIDKNLIATAVQLQDDIENQAEHNEEPITTPKEKELLNTATDVIRARTLSILRRLGQDKERKGDVIRFLIEAEVISKLQLNLSEANLRNVSLRGADLSSVSLSSADLNSADFNSANLRLSNLRLSNLSDAKLIDTNLSLAKLFRANLNGADLSSAKLIGTNLSHANLNGATLNDTDLNGANLKGIQDWTENQLAAAKLCRTMLPEGCNLNPNRDCKALGISLDPPATESSK